ncbi:MAG: zinc ribbon domain-containing protein [Oscillospiraceae bacterium]|nr:zinc ribbon domain-containing protein [Oscillospiraceae bacterium]
MKSDNNIAQNSKQFCIWCGNEIKPGSKFCPKCGKKQIEEENQLIDWLIAHTKDKLKGDAESSLFDAIKNFILSHLYGTIMSIAIIAAAGITVYASEPYIEKYRDADKPEYITAALEGNNSDSNINNNTSATIDTNAVRTICNDYLRIISKENIDPTGSSFGLCLPSDFEIKGNYEVLYDERFLDTSTFILRSSTSKTISKPEEFTLDLSGQLYKNGYKVAEYVKEQYIEDAASAEKVYTREVAFSVVEINGQLYIAESKLNSFIENKDYEWPIVIDEAKLVAMMTDYINAVFAGDDLSPYEYHLPYEDELTLNRDVLTLPDECNGFIRVAKVQLGLYNRHSSMTASKELEKIGVETFTADFNIQVEEQIEGRFMNTHHYFVFAVIDGEYYVVDDFIQSVGHSG